MSKKSLVAGLDIGSNQVCCVASASDDETRISKILSAISIPCDGIKAGAVINIQETALAIGKAFEEMEKVAGGQIGNVVVALRGNFIHSRTSKGVANINYSNREVTEETVENALESARKQIKMEPDQEILQIVPREYVLNQQGGIQNPIGMEGTYIEVDIHAFIASSSNIGNINKSMASVGINCNNRVYGYLAASDILITREEKELSCLVVDFGGLTTGLVHYVDGTVRHTDELLNGSDYITRDIGHKLRTSYSISKEIKEKYGAAFIYSDFSNEEFEYKATDGRNIKKYSRHELVNGIITPRIDRILYEIKELTIRNNYGDEFLSGGIILTGGGSNLPGLAEAFEKAFNCSIRLGTPNSDKVVGIDEIVLNSSYTTAIGAVASNYSSSGFCLEKKSSKNGVVSKISKWFEEVF
ncbi:MAG: cell division protein FtsA [Endomicrobium sp.]|jgi:cell division protein FtsA|nr:cell division protein FtsA [Endomicrobium sp.]